MMPVMNEWQFREAQRRSRRLADIPIVEGPRLCGTVRPRAHLRIAHRDDLDHELASPA
jgi:hypothetical protein